MIRVLVDDLATLAADAIVRPTTTRLEVTTAATQRLEAAGGAEFAHASRLQVELGVGAAVVTAGGGELPSEFVIHAVVESPTEPPTRAGVTRAWQSALQQAQAWGFARITAPPLGAGPGLLSVEDAADIMAGGLRDHLSSAGFPQDVTIVVDTPEEQSVFETALRREALPTS